MLYVRFGLPSGLVQGVDVLRVVFQGSWSSLALSVGSAEFWPVYVLTMPVNEGYERLSTYPAPVAAPSYVQSYGGGRLDLLIKCPTMKYKYYEYEGWLFLGSANNFNAPFNLYDTTICPINNKQPTLASHSQPSSLNTIVPTQMTSFI